MSLQDKRIEELEKLLNVENREPTAEERIQILMGILTMHYVTFPDPENIPDEFESVRVAKEWQNKMSKKEWASYVRAATKPPKHDKKQQHMESASASELRRAIERERKATSTGK